MIGALRVRLLLLVLAPLVPVLVVAFVNARQAREESLDEVRAEMRSLARLAGQTVRQRVEATGQLLGALGQAPAVRAGGPACTDALRAELRQAPSYDNLLVTDAAGRVACAAALPARPGRSVAGSDWFRDLRASGSPAVGSEFAPIVAARPALMVAVAAPAARGAAAAAIDLGQFNRLAAAIDLPRSGSLVILGPGGRVLARHPDPAEFVGRSVRDTPLAAAARSGRAHAEVTGLDGVRRIYGFDRVRAGRGQSLVVAAGLARDDIGAAADSNLRRTLAVLGLVALAAVLLVLLAGNLFIARPLAAVMDRSTRQRQSLLAELVAAEEQERKRIADDLHDDSIQALAALLLRLEMLESRLEEDDHRRRLAEAREAAADAVRRLRHMVFVLNPPALESDGLAPALTDYLDEVSRVWGPETALESALEREPSSELRALVYRIAVEAVTNAAKHGAGGRIDVALAPLDGGVRVRVRDEGAGFDAAADRGPAHYGLRNMRERAEAAGGWWRLDSAPGRGTTVEFFVPDRGAA